MSEPQFEINRIYIKDLSSEAPSAPEIFTENWEPNINLNLGNSSTLIDEEQGIYNIVLSLTVSATIGKKTAYMIEIEQAGIFTITGFDEAQLGYVIGALVPNILFPYARETISSLSQKAGFPPIILNPIDFNVVYQQHVQQSQAANTNEVSEENNETKH